MKKRMREKCECLIISVDFAALFWWHISVEYQHTLCTYFGCSCWHYDCLRRNFSLSLTKSLACFNNNNYLFAWTKRIERTGISNTEHYKHNIVLLFRLLVSVVFVFSSLNVFVFRFFFYPTTEHRQVNGTEHAIQVNLGSMYYIVIGWALMSFRFARLVCTLIKANQFLLRKKKAHIQLFSIQLVVSGVLVGWYSVAALIQSTGISWDRAVTSS